MKRRVIMVAGLALAAACTNENPSAPTQAVAPVLSQAPDQGPLRDRYIVVFRSSVSDVDAEVDRAVQAFGAQVHYRYYTAIKGFAATLPAPALEGLSRNPSVEFIEADGEMTIDASQSPATWGLDRIDQVSLPLNSTYNYNSTGAGVTAYIIDTGIRFSQLGLRRAAATRRPSASSGRARDRFPRASATPGSPACRSSSSKSSSELARRRSVARPASMA